MQVSATLIAAQQAAREAQAKFRATNVAPPQAGFAAALEKTAGAAQSFSPLPFKQTVSAPDTVSAPPQDQGARLGTLLDIKI